jgi:hypothetical protein
MDTIEYDQASLMIALIQMTHGRWDVEELIAMHGYISARVVRPAGRGAEVVGDSVC